MFEIINCDQGSEEWLRARLGVPTASNFKAILAKGEGKTRQAYMNRLAAEIVTGDPLESFCSPSMERGKWMEEEARNFYSFINDIEPELVGFVKNSKAGASPDSFIGNNGLLEIKTQRGDLLIETINRDVFPHEHKPQVQGQLWICERDFCDLIVYWPKLPPFIKRAYRDETYIEKLEQAIDQFNEELNNIVERIRSYGSVREAA